jgi:hypothetical protein
LEEIKIGYTAILLHPATAVEVEVGVGVGVSVGVAVGVLDSEGIADGVNVK